MTTNTSPDPDEVLAAAGGFSPIEIAIKVALPLGELEDLLQHGRSFMLHGMTHLQVDDLEEVLRVHWAKFPKLNMAFDRIALVPKDQHVYGIAYEPVGKTVAVTTIVCRERSYAEYVQRAARAKRTPVSELPG